MHKYLILILLLTCRICHGQNLVPNGDFEQYSSCPTYVSQIDLATLWMQPTEGTSDYYNVCGTGLANIPNGSGGFQLPHSGNGFAAVINYCQTPYHYREYIEVKLNSKLIYNSCYHFEMYINLANVSKFNSNNIGIYFSNVLINGIDNELALPYIPQINNITILDTLNWTLVSGDYNALGGENYIIIGNFYDDPSTTFSVYNPSAIHSTSYIYIDDVALIPCIPTRITEQNETLITIFPNPLDDQLVINTNNNDPTEITLYDITSEKILQQNFTNTLTLNTEKLPKGIYIYELRYKNELIKKGKVIKE